VTRAAGGSELVMRGWQAPHTHWFGLWRRVGTEVFIPWTWREAQRRVLPVRSICDL
jgi:hypothetical protein